MAITSKIFVLLMLLFIFTLPFTVFSQNRTRRRYTRSVNPIDLDNLFGARGEDPNGPLRLQLHRILNADPDFVTFLENHFKIMKGTLKQVGDKCIKPPAQPTVQISTSKPSGSYGFNLLPYINWQRQIIAKVTQYCSEQYYLGCDAGTNSHSPLSSKTNKCKCGANDLTTEGTKCVLFDGAECGPEANDKQIARFTFKNPLYSDARFKKIFRPTAHDCKGTSNCENPGEWFAPKTGDVCIDTIGTDPNIDKHSKLGFKTLSDKLLSKMVLGIGETCSEVDEQNLFIKSATDDVSFKTRFTQLEYFVNSVKFCNYKQNFQCKAGKCECIPGLTPNSAGNACALKVGEICSNPVPNPLFSKPTTIVIPTSLTNLATAGIPPCISGSTCHQYKTDKACTCPAGKHGEDCTLDDSPFTHAKLGPDAWNLDKHDAVLRKELMTTLATNIEKVFNRMLLKQRGDKCQPEKDKILDQVIDFFDEDKIDTTEITKLHSNVKSAVVNVNSFDFCHRTSLLACSATDKNTCQCKSHTKWDSTAKECRLKEGLDCNYQSSGSSCAVINDPTLVNTPASTICSSPLICTDLLSDGSKTATCQKISTIRDKFFTHKKDEIYNREIKDYQKILLRRKCNVTINQQLNTTLVDFETNMDKAICISELEDALKILDQTIQNKFPIKDPTIRRYCSIKGMRKNEEHYCRDSRTGGRCRCRIRGTENKACAKKSRAINIRSNSALILLISFYSLFIFI